VERALAAYRGVMVIRAVVFASWWIAGCAAGPDAGPCSFTHQVPVQLDGPLVALGTGWGVISNQNTYVEIDEHGDVVAMAALPAALISGALIPGVQKHALTWNGQQVATYLSDSRITMFDADGTHQRQGPKIEGAQGIVRATSTGYEAEIGQRTTDACMLWKLDADGAPVSATSFTGWSCLNTFPSALAHAAGQVVFVASWFCGSPGIGEAFCPVFPGLSTVNTFSDVHGSPLGLDADDDGTTMLAVASAGFGPMSPGAATGMAWRSAGGAVEKVAWSTSAPLSVAWTGAFWETIALTDHGTIAEERLDADLHLTSAHDLTTDTSFVRAPVVAADAHRALIAIGYAGTQTITQVCY
jgi:hypothetical protein